MKQELFYIRLQLWEFFAVISYVVSFKGSKCRFPTEQCL